MAGLPGVRASVSVGPPLSASAPSSGLVFERSPGPENWQVSASSRLLPSDVTRPPVLQLLAAAAPLVPKVLVLPARMLFSTWALPFAMANPPPSGERTDPPPSACSVLSAIVELVTTTVLVGSFELKIAAPSRAALSAIVESATTRWPGRSGVPGSP
jgi:hypothetical protein